MGWRAREKGGEIRGRRAMRGREGGREMDHDEDIRGSFDVDREREGHTVQQGV